jgi:uncharacterized protein (DUF169 family)
VVQTKRVAILQTQIYSSPIRTGELRIRLKRTAERLYLRFDDDELEAPIWSIHLNCWKEIQMSLAAFVKGMVHSEWNSSFGIQYGIDKS